MFVITLAQPLVLFISLNSDAVITLKKNCSRWFSYFFQRLNICLVQLCEHPKIRKLNTLTIFT